MRTAAPLRGGDPVELRLDLLEPPRLGLERGGEGREVACALTQAELDVAELLRGARELRSEPLHLGEGALRVRDERRGAVAVLGGERGARRRGRGGELAQVAEPLALGEPAEGAADRVRGLAADAGVDLVEDERLAVAAVTRARDGDRERHA